MTTKKALLIGCNYLTIPNAKLQGCINDAVNIQNMLIDAYDYNPSDIITLRDDTKNPNYLPTRSNILAQLTNIIANSGSCSELWIHYSGHGTRSRDLNGDEVSGMDSAIVPLDYKTAGFIIDDELFRIIKNVKCRLILMFDSCNSGTVCDLQWSFQYQNKDTYVRSQNNVFSIANPNIFMFSGCRDSQFSADSYSLEEQEPVGAFTNALIQVLRAKRHNVQIVLLYRDVCNYLTSGGFGQNPVFSSSAPVPNYRFIRASPV